MEQSKLVVDRIRLGYHERPIVLYGLRGVGKTVLLNRMRDDAESVGVIAASIESPEDRSLVEFLVPALRSALLKLSRSARVTGVIDEAKSALVALLRSAKVKQGDIEVGGFDVSPIVGLADSGDLRQDLAELFVKVGEAARANDKCVALYIDEMQYVREKDLGALLVALHTIAQKRLPVTLFGAGLPQLLGLLGKARSYAERLLAFEEIGALSPEAAREALILPAKGEGLEFAIDAVDHVMNETRGYPYFIQEWGKHCWNLAQGSPVTLEEAREAGSEARREMDAGFFHVRFDRLTPREKEYLLRMATLGPGPHRSGDIAKKARESVVKLAPVRQGLILKGVVYSPAHGLTAFTVPLFDEFLRRTLGEEPGRST